ncbi:AfsR/SARP family transcriptional regulator [Lentzea flaviverrucosa]|uniref:DNA-binding transcriptional activator of the SARP family n=1 Tax=Lentzea flaviverrucosa TaxID=200379 RepID=A0A1H9XWD9_9PSEU|nr:BTAD domain-containing putative transcriptional regulator [Lentzea flaviverrucosa]RDI34415.1 DNA-binding SARP family transcriptional activator [Lentzea flaviverrucosa]SES50414.1 DNA-binding transcriptional activator of the SARP family [Lentzea flaviverrucosa]
MRVLGPLEVWRNGRRENLGGVKQRALLAHLALHANTDVSLDQLIEALWPSTRPRSVVQNVRTYVWRLRQLLNEQLRTHGTGYVLELEADELDALMFDELVAQARRRPDAALGLLRRAESLWRGRPLEDLPGHDAWAPALARLDEARLAATEQRLGLQVASGECAEAIPELRALLAEHPYRESVCGQLVLALHQDNRRAEALQVYADMRVRLTGELGLEPGSALREAQLAVLRDEPAPAPLRQLPPTVFDFCGRAGEIAVLTTALRQGSAPAVVTGPPGVGKSTLAIRVAHQVGDHFPDGQLYVDLGGTSDHPREPGDVLTELLHALGITGAGLPAQVTARAALFRSKLAGRRVLVVLDDAASVSQLMPLLPADAGCAVLVTSRRRLSELPGALQVELSPFSPEEAAELLTAIAGEDRVCAQPDEAAAIAAACGHLPLAIRVAGARLAGRGRWSMQVLRERLVDESTRLRELTSGELAVRASFDLSIRQLSPREFQAFVRLALLGPHDFPSWVVETLLGEPGTEHLVDGLVDAHLLETFGADGIGQPRYRLHDLLRCHALNHALPDGRAALERTLRAWLWLAVTAARRLPVTFGTTIADVTPVAAPEHLLAEPVAWFEAERRTLCGAVDIAADAGLDEVAWQLAAACVPFFDLHSHYEDWARTHARALRSVRAAGNRVGEAALLRGISQVHIYRSEFTEAEQGLLAAQELYRSLRDYRGQGTSLAGIGVVYRLRAEYERSLEFYGEGLRLLELAGDLHSVAHVRASIGGVHSSLGRPEEARKWLTNARRLAADLGDAHREALVLVRLSALCRSTGEHEQELVSARRAVTILTDLTDERCTAFAQVELAEALISNGHPQEAHSLLRQALETYRRTGNREGEPAARRALARAAASADQLLLPYFQPR